MAIHRITHIELGVPDLEAVRDFYLRFGLEAAAPGELATARGGRQLRLGRASERTLVELGLGVACEEDLGALASQLSRMELQSQRDGATLRVTEPVTGLRVALAVSESLAGSLSAPLAPEPPGDGRGARPVRALDRPTPGKLGHVVIASPDAPATQRFFIEGLGFRVSDRLADVGAAFLRCSRDHHNLLVQPGPRYFMHHTAWELPDVDAVGRAGMRMVDLDRSCHTWGLGRHTVGSNYFWYLRDPAGNFAEYYSDVDVIDDEAAWQAQSHHGRDQLLSWGPDAPLEFLLPPDIFPPPEAP